MRYAVTVLTLGLAVLGTAAAMARPAAGSCVQQDLAAQVARADVIASGRVVSVGAGGGPLIFRATTILKGALDGGGVSVQNGPSDGVATSVDYRAATGDHVLYLQGTGRGFTTNACSGSHPGPPTADEMHLLGPGTPVPPGDGGLLGELGLGAAAIILGGATALYVRKLGTARRTMREG